MIGYSIWLRPANMGGLNREKKGDDEPKKGDQKISEKRKKKKIPAQQNSITRQHTI